MFQVKGLKLVRDCGTECGPRHLYNILIRMQGPNTAAFALPHDASDEEIVRNVKNWICSGKKGLHTSSSLDISYDCRSVDSSIPSRFSPYTVCGKDLSFDTNSWLETGWNGGKARAVLAILYACCYTLGAKCSLLQTLTSIPCEQQKVVQQALATLDVPKGNYLGQISFRVLHSSDN